MKLVILFIVLSWFILFVCVFSDIDLELRKSIEAAMKCQYREPPKSPVIAVTPSRFIQIVAILHGRFGTPACIRPPKSPINVYDERNYPFCVFGRCIQGKCQCAGHFSGPKCSVYTQRCWLMYCYLTSCHPSHQSLHCICDPSLYGTKITTGIYWYNEGKSSKYIPPPVGWKDDPTNTMQWKGDSATGELVQRQHAPNVLPAKNSFQESNAPIIPQGIRNHELSASQINQKKKPHNAKVEENGPRFNLARRVFGSRVPTPKNNENSTVGIKIYGQSESKPKNADAVGDGIGVNDKKSEKTDVEEALEQLEESAALLLPANNIYIFILNSIVINFLVVIL